MEAGSEAVQPTMVSRERCRAMRRQHQQATQATSSHNKRARKKAEEQLLRDQLPLLGPGLPNRDALVPPAVDTTHSSHECCITGGLCFCWRCGCLSASNASKLQRVCQGPPPAGSMNRLSRLRKGKLPPGMSEWPDGESARAIRQVYRYHA